MATVKETATEIIKSKRFKKAFLDEESNQTDVISIFVDFAFAIFEATKEKCARVYGQNRFGNSTDIKKFIKDVEFPTKINVSIR